MLALIEDAPARSVEDSFVALDLAPLRAGAILNLAPALAAGFTTLGPLQVWFRPS